MMTEDQYAKRCLSAAQWRERATSSKTSTDRAVCESLAQAYGTLTEQLRVRRSQRRAADIALTGSVD